VATDADREHLLGGGRHRSKRPLQLRSLEPAIGSVDRLRSGHRVRPQLRVIATKGRVARVPANTWSVAVDLANAALTRMAATWH